MTKISSISLVLIIVTILSGCGSQKKYVQYRVQEGETIRKLAQKYHIKTTDLLSLNPGVSRRPKANTIIRIPNKKYQKFHSIGLAHKTHTVLLKETIYSISKKYQVSFTALEKANPILRQGLKKGMVLTIPKSDLPSDAAILKEEEKRIKTLEKRYILHKVLKKETYYNIGKRYNVSVDHLKSLNPELIAFGLNEGMLLKVKKRKATDIIKSLTNKTILNDNIKGEKVVNVSLLLPLKLDKNDGVSEYNLFSSKNSLASIVTDFYLGAQIAIDSIENLGLVVNLNIFDTGQKDENIGWLSFSKKLQQSDVIIGPFYSSEAKKIASNLPKIPVIFPVYSKNQQAFSQKNLIKSETDATVFENKLLDYFTTHYALEHIVLINANKKNSTLVDSIEARLLKDPYIDSISILNPSSGYITEESFKQATDSTITNWAVLVGNDIAITASAVNHLNVLSQKIPVKLFATKKGANFDKLDNNHLANINFTYASSGIMVNSLANVQGFYEKYAALNHAYPSTYAKKGFDLTFDILIRLGGYESLEESFTEYYSERIESKFNYNVNEKGAFENQAVYLLQYNEDLDIEVLE